MARIRKAGGIAYNINTNVRDGCNSYSNGGKLYQLVSEMKTAGFPVDVHVFQSCGHGYCAYRYPNGHQALYWFSRQFKRNLRALGINRELPHERVAATPSDKGKNDSLDSPRSAEARPTLSPFPGFW